MLHSERMAGAFDRRLVVVGEVEVWPARPDERQRWDALGPLGRLVNTAGRYPTLTETLRKWHDAQVFDSWNQIKASADLKVQHWP